MEITQGAEHGRALRTGAQGIHVQQKGMHQHDEGPLGAGAIIVQAALQLVQRSGYGSGEGRAGPRGGASGGRLAPGGGGVLRQHAA